MDAWHYDPAVDLEQPVLERLRNFPREPDMFVYGLRGLCALVLRGWLRCYHRLQVVGRENLPADRSFVMVANHASHLDALCLLSTIPLRRLHHAFPAAARDYFFTNLPRAAASAIVVNALPFERHSLPRQSLSVCRQLLERPGNILILFPEGTRSPAGAIGEFKAGIGLLVAGTSIPVVPCALQGSYAAWPKGAWFPRPRRIALTIGSPREYAQLTPCKESALHIASDLRDAVRTLLPGPI